MKNCGIRLKLILWFSLILVTIVGVTMMTVFSASKAVLLGAIRDHLVSAVEENADNVRYAAAAVDRGDNVYIPWEDGYLEIDLDFITVADEAQIALCAGDGTLIYGESPLRGQTEQIPFLRDRTRSMRTEAASYEIYDRQLDIPLPGGQSLWLRGVVPETDSEMQLGQIARRTLLFLPLLILLSVLLVWLLAGRLLAPIRKIEETAERISRGDDLKQRITVSPSSDEVGRLAVVFNRMLDRLERSFEAEKQFTSDASHELRTPVSVLLAQTEYTLEKRRGAEEYIEALEVVQKQGRRMEALVDDMLACTHMEQNPQRYPMEPLDLSGLAAETAAQMALIGSGGITLATEIESGIRITGNRALLARLMQNLISNAYRYGKENGHILVGVRREDGQAVLSVRDDGIGIPEEEQGRIFNRFYRGDLSRSEQGTGLGLSIAQKIAELHGTVIRVESEAGRGSTFSVRFAAENALMNP